MRYLFRPMRFHNRAPIVRTLLWPVAVSAVLCVCHTAFGDQLTRLPVESDHLSVDVGRSGVFQTTSDIKEIRVADAGICTAEVVGNDQNSISVTGLTRGSTTLSVWLTRPNSVPQIYVVDVVTAADTYRVISDFIQLQFPTSRVTLTPVPSSTKVIVSGTLASYQEWERVLVLIDGTIPRTNLIVSVTIPCTPCPCPGCSHGRRRCR